MPNEGTVNWEAAAEKFALGDPSEPDTADDNLDTALPDTPSTPQKDVEVTISGQKITVSPVVAAAIEDQRREMRARDGHLGGENARLKEELAEIRGAISQMPTPSTDAPTFDPPDPKEALEGNFAKWQADMIAYMAGTSQEGFSELREQYESAQDAAAESARNQQDGPRFAVGFYGAYPPLDRPIVKLEVARLYGDHKGEVESQASPAQQYAYLAGLVQDSLNDAFGAKLPDPTKRTTNRPPTLEGAGTPVAPTQPDAPDKPLSLSAVVRARKADLRGDKPAGD